jgi:ribosomal-protein-alanine N-acetyltransferase
MRLIAIKPGGVLEEEVGACPPEVGEVVEGTVHLYQGVGYEPPWICYVALANDTVVGSCGFKSPPRGGCVEIAYYTFPGYEGKGVATQMARQLIRIARAAQPGLTVSAQTLPARNPSHRILEKLGFQCMGMLEHPEDGTVLEWHYAAAKA